MSECPNCHGRCHLDEFMKYFCKSCGAKEMQNTTGNGSMWIIAGRVVALPTAVAEQLAKARLEWDSGDWPKEEE